MAVCKYSTLVPPLVPGHTVLWLVFLHWCPRSGGAPAGAPEDRTRQCKHIWLHFTCVRFAALAEAAWRLRGCFQVMNQYT